MTRPLILVTNDDGINSPGLGALAYAVDPLGDLLIVAPRLQQSGTGRSMPHNEMIDGLLFRSSVRFKDKSWEAYAVNATPALAVQHGLIELAQRPVAMVVSGINYGENVGTGLTISGTVGAALEAASHGLPALAISLEVPPSLHLSYDPSINWDGAIHFARLFAEKWMGSVMPLDVDVLKIDVPSSATATSPWMITRLERLPYFIPTRPERQNAFEQTGRVGYAMADPRRFSAEDTDASAVARGVVSVTPVSLDMTSRIDLGDMKNFLEEI